MGKGTSKHNFSMHISKFHAIPSKKKEDIWNWTPTKIQVEMGRHELSIQIWTFQSIPWSKPFIWKWTPPLHPYTIEVGVGKHGLSVQLWTFHSIPSNNIF